MANKMLKASFGVTLVMVVGYIVSFLKESVIANYYGVSSDVDAYTIAISIPVELFTFVTVAIQSVVIPIYSEFLYNKGLKDANGYIDKLISLLLLGSIVLIMIGEVAADGFVFLFAPGFSSDVHNLSTQLLRIVFPSVLFSVICQVLVALLNVHKQYVINSFAIFFLNVFTIASVALYHSAYGIYAAAIGQLIGNIAKCLFVVFLARKYYRYAFHFTLKDDSVKDTMKKSIPVFWSMSIAEINTMINKVVASFLFVGSISALTYASKINTVLMHLFVSAIATIVYPMYAESTAKKDMEQLNRRINITISGYSLFVIPLMVGLLVFKEDIVKVAFGRGVFDADAVFLTQNILGYYTIGLLFMSIRSTITNVFYSLQDTKTPSINATWGAIINVVLNVTLPFFMGVQGLALASSLTAMYITSRLLILLVKKHPEIQLEFFFTNLKGISLSSVVMFGALFILQQFVVIGNSYVNLAIGASLGIIVYFASLVLLRVPMVKLLISMIKR